jgi:thioredoxin-like negative regulator of GroEL
MDNFIQQKDINIVFFTNDRFSELNTKIKDQSKILGESHFLFIDTDKECDLIKNLNIKSVPLFYIYKDGKLIEEVFGTYSNICDIIRLHF